MGKHPDANQSQSEGTTGSSLLLEWKQGEIAKGPVLLAHSTSIQQAALLTSSPHQGSPPR